MATEAALSVALALPTVPHAEAGTAPPGPPRGRERQWRQFWQLEASGPELFRALDAPPWPAPPAAVATFPALAPVSTQETPVRQHIPHLGEALASCTHRDQVGKLVLAALAEEGTRVALFSLHHGKVMGWMGRGLDLVDEDLHTFILPLDRPSVFLNLSRGMEMHVGPLVGGEGNEALLEALGPPPPAAAAVVPIRVRGKTVAFLWLDRGEDGVSDVSVPQLQEVARLAGLALEMLVVRQKLKAVSSLTAGEVEH
uniref:GAF domain-containing protein n=1 Tax=Thermoanaerobaculum aquaticum TaxID=1312852 RepID=A0A7V2EFR6_9BACT